MGLKDAILNVVDFAPGGKPRVDRDCDPRTASFLVSVETTVHEKAISLLFSSPQPHARHQINLCQATLPVPPRILIHQYFILKLRQKY